MDGNAITPCAEGGKVMSTYIRAVVAAKAIEEKYGIPLGDLVDTFVNIPAADVVEVVKCRECLCYTPVDDNMGECVFLNGKHLYVVPDGYCHLGELKEGADNDT